MRVLLASSERGFRGGERQLALLAAGLARRGAEVTVACAGGSPLAQALTPLGIPVADVPMRGALDLAAAGRLRALGRRHDVVHAYTPNAHALCALAGLGGGPPLVATRHLDFPLRDSLWNRAKYGACARIVCVSRAVRQALTCGGVDAARTVVIPCAIPAPVLPDRDAARRELGLAPDAVAVLNLAAWVEQKDPLLLLDAWPTVAAAAPTAVLLMAGGGALEAELRARATTLDRVQLLGHRDDVPRLLAAADAFVLPSRNEGLPLAIMEAQSAGLPVLATRAGGSPELIDDGTDGLLIGIGDRTALAERLVRLASDAQLRTRLGAAARLRARSYAPDRFVRAHQALYRRVVRA